VRRETRAKRIKAARHRRKLTQTQLAAMVGCEQHTVHYWETSGAAPGNSYLKALAKALDIPIEDLVLER
jgi:transcriptional regulator with XRE-family HTH domain